MILTHPDRYDRRVFAEMQSVSLRDVEGFGLLLIILCNCGLAAPGDCIRVMDWSERCDALRELMLPPGQVDNKALLLIHLKTPVLIGVFTGYILRMGCSCPGCSINNHCIQYTHEYETEATLSRHCEAEKAF